MVSTRIWCAGLILALAAVWSGPAAAGYKQVNSPNPNDEMAVSIYELDNGLTVYLTVNRETPRFYAEIAVRAGSKQDPAESTGLAHYLEHLLFKGSTQLGTLNYEAERPHIERIEELYQQHFHETDPEKRKALYAEINAETMKAAEYAIPNEMDRLYKAMGGTMLNAHTWHEETVYKINLPKNRLEQWAAIEAERFASPVFRLFQTELETVYEEMNRALDNKDRIIQYAVDGQLYKTHPYGQQPTLGKVEHLKNPSLKNIGDYYDTYYVPNNMAIFISGDIDKDETIALIDQYFSPWAPKPLPGPQSWDEQPLQGREEVVRTYQGEEFVMLAFRTASNKHENYEALTLLDMILDNASAGLININLNQQQRVRQAGSYPGIYNDYGAQFLWGIPKEGQTLAEVEALLLEQIERIKNGEFDDWLLPAIINDFKKTTKRGLESDPARVADMRSTWLEFQDWDEHVARFERLEKVTKEDVMRVAKTYFGDNYVAGLRKDAPHEVPDIEKPELAAIKIDPQRSSEFAARIMQMPVEPIEPEFVDRDNDLTIVEPLNGVRLYYVQNPLNDLFSLSIRVPVGTRTDNTLNMAAMLFDKSGTKDLSAEDLRKEWYKLGTDLSIGAAEEESSISLSGLDENFASSVSLLQALMSDPRADAGVLDELKKIILVQREDAQKQVESIASALVAYNRFGAESEHLTRMTNAEVQAIGAKALYANGRALLDYPQDVTYVGTLPLETVVDALKRFYGPRRTVKPAPDLPERPIRAPGNTEIYFVDKDAAQAQIRLEFGSVKYDPGLSPAIDLYNNYFAGGMAGIVFQELREARALAYSAGARYIEGDEIGDQSLMVGVIGSQADKTVEAVKAFIELLDDLPASEERFATTREALINRYRTGKIGFRGVAGAVRGWEKLGLPGDPREAAFNSVLASSLPNLLQFHGSIIADQPKLISVVGDGDKIGMEKLAEIAPVRSVNLKEIFSE
jgi:predicted Zn-dependent peptidase